MLPTRLQLSVTRNFIQPTYLYLYALCEEGMIITIPSLEMRKLRLK